MCPSLIRQDRFDKCLDNLKNCSSIRLCLIVSFGLTGFVLGLRKLVQSLCFFEAWRGFNLPWLGCGRSVWQLSRLF